MGHSKFSVDSPTLEAASTSGVPEPQSIPMLAVVEEELDHAPADPQIGILSSLLKHVNCSNLPRCM